MRDKKFERNEPAAISNCGRVNIPFDCYISEIYQDFLSSLDVGQYNQIVSVVNHYRTEYNKIKKENGSVCVAYNFHRLIDEMFEKVFADFDMAQIPCRKGCSHCCNHNVDITDDEAKRILDHCDFNNVKINWRRIKVQKEKGVDNWEDLSEKTRQCVFLFDNGICTIYDARPSKCRIHYSQDDVKACVDTKGRTRMFFAYEPQTVSVAIHNATESDSLAKMLYKLRKWNNERD